MAVVESPRYDEPTHAIAVASTKAPNDFPHTVPPWTVRLFVDRVHRSSVVDTLWPCDPVRSRRIAPRVLLLTLVANALTPRSPLYGLIFAYKFSPAFAPRFPEWFDLGGGCRRKKDSCRTRR